MRFLRNLTSTSTLEGNPWEYNELSRVPPLCLSDKEARGTWANDPNTEFMFYSGFVGINENGRVSDKGGSDEGNPAQEMNSFVGDYDAKFTEQEIESAIARMPIKPNWVEISLSGNWRLIWIFERPILLPSRNFTCFLLKHIHELLPILELSNLDRGYLEASRYYANGCQWRRIHDIPVGAARLQGWVLKLSEKYAWKDSEPGVAIPFEVLANRFRELHTKFPRFLSWPGEFKDGAQGPSFWIEGSTSPMSAVVRPNGMQTFAGHAHKSWFTWSELLGADWVKSFQENRIGQAVTDIYFDGHDYAIKNESGRWDIENKDGVINELIVMRGLSREVSKKKMETFSEVDSAFAYIRKNMRVKGMASFAFFRKGRMKFNGDEVLNLHTKDAMRPAMEEAKWGPTGQFPWLSAYYDRYFATPNQLPYYLSWGAHFYRGCYCRNLFAGHTLFTAGPVGAGKTVNSRLIFAPLVGGFAEAKDYLLGEDNFNSELFDYALHVVDDTSVTANSYLYKKFCEMVKRHTANVEARCNEKFRKATTVGCRARLMITCNDDAESILMPDLDLSMKDKVMLFRVAPPAQKFPKPEDFQKILDEELPWFARYLLDWQVPAECRSDSPEDSRFGGILPYHDPLLVNTAAQSSRTASLAEILDVWMRDYFTKRESTANTWKGTVLDLYQSIMVDPSLTELMRQFPLDLMKRQLATLANGQQFRIKINGDSRRRTYEIDRCTHYPKATEEALNVEQKEVSRFQRT